MKRTAVVLAAMLVWLVLSATADADVPPMFASRPDAQITESDAIQLAVDEAVRHKIDLEHFDPPSATYISDGYRSKWHVFFIAKSQHVDACFSVDIYRLTERPHFSWCS
jgi:hypothetical protein